MTIRCFECSQLALRGFPKHANEGLGKCKLNTNSGEFVSYLFKRECSDYARAEEGAILKRVAWREQVEMFRRVKK